MGDVGLELPAALSAGIHAISAAVRLRGLLRVDRRRRHGATGAIRPVPDDAGAWRPRSESLLSAEIDGEQLRDRLLESTRSYAAERLLQDPLCQVAERHHAQIVLSALEASEAEWAWVDNSVWRARYEARTADLRKALDWCFSDTGDVSLGVDLAIAGIRLWNEQSSLFEQLSQVERALNHCASMKDALQETATLAESRGVVHGLWRVVPRRHRRRLGQRTRFRRAQRRDVGQRLSVMCGMSLFLVATGRHEQVISLLDDVIRIAALAGERASLFDGERLRAMADVRRGNLLDAQSKLEGLAEELARGIPQSRHVRYQQQTYASIHGMLAFSTWLTVGPSVSARDGRGDGVEERSEWAPDGPVSNPRALCHAVGVLEWPTQHL